MTEIINSAPTLPRNEAAIIRDRTVVLISCTLKFALKLYSQTVELIVSFNFDPVNGQISYQFNN